MLRFLFRTILLGWLLPFCVATVLSSLVWAATLSAQLTAAATSHATALAAQKTKAQIEQTKAVSKEKAKARLKRLMVAVPVVGTAAAAGFEYHEYAKWQENNPGKSASDYACEIAQSSKEIIDEVLFEMPEKYRPPRAFLLRLSPECQVIRFSPNL